MGSITPQSESRLFKPLKIGNVTLQHRIVLAPMTRNRNDDDHTPVPLMEKYYADRASTPGTLIISEATSISHAEEGQRNIPGFVSDRQVAAWSKIIQGVHAKGSFYFQQIWGVGRSSTPDYIAQRGFPYRSSSDVPMEGSDAAPRAMTEEEILQTIQDFVDTAKRVVAAGGDGVGIHAGYGYLLHQFLSDAVNKRTDKWGGSIENRSRLTLDVVKAIVAAIGAEKVAIRLSPYVGFHEAIESDIYELYTYLVGELKKMDVKFAYLSLIEATGDPAVIVLGAEAPNKGKTLDFILEAWDNLSPVIVAGGYEPETAGLALDDHYKKWDVLIAFGRHFLANPDLVFRVKNGVELNKYNRATFYLNPTGGVLVRYNDYPFSKEFLKVYKLD
ncbi:NADH:flavin oxidoreductase NADH oxidase family protein [Fusarium oxysporum Fo47]|uniref:NADH:flavin oxidoreductase NADH oxidase family protein n=1 Tax=Fusarium oxysporum Fo47 TaxID=660027 RepID=UPI0028698116|nr:NADH:flavin oxidoreductase NADH oxidase family protein [Fusarium oxysporum Fo47]QKD56859.2 NADH:flavin oxidoreductase NADH oxidase family protein [Fusarium oxysporum Fo47]